VYEEFIVLGGTKCKFTFIVVTIYIVPNKSGPDLIETYHINNNLK